ncbi:MULTISPECIES: ATP-binding protein [unclassified Ruminococcus]|uniref:ATP-binding protein n=1 Tax=unclassified Ruminococcus TaxID=2608920 RepID=UPI00210CA396|nr:MULTISPECIES: ATP-binding protein [unclassified Ruminococcus]MCQ4023384.1 ATP-binding protein [Ruminococcus sp. zg-924]MCQ4115751.1 ATP-binding protein [Ruminococcus sp. zg-921]
MGYSKSVYGRADRILSERRLTAQRNADKAQQSFYSAYPIAREIEHKLTHTFTNIARATLSGDHEKLLEIKKENLELQRKLAQVYALAGISEEDLKPKYTCSHCNDKGNVDGVACDCYINLLKQIACDDLNLRSPLSLSDFESFDLSYYPEECRHKMSNILSYCSNYAENFNSNSDSVIMTGGTGLGKTHLALAIANEVIKKGKGVIYITAPDMVSTLEEYQFGRETEESEVTPKILSDCDLLIIDDLGTEFLNNFSKGAVYNVFNSRITRGNPTIINTNLTIQELEKNYTDRFVSRVTGYCRRLHFEGSDIRILKKMRGIK